ncbi:adenylosuccinate lyase domain protein [Mycobacterium xenopi 4042]|uniref:Adenylosuccinate lyase domain protein n=1 Tax=Mycobacterium xenopi 4042 TaxID=1299334 RepID=X7ZWY3_MYCXE|nr:adenylosuccinate lyase domain protein [Mycobacterium xenopi 4042]
MIGEHAVAAALAMRDGGEPELLERLAADPGCRWTAARWTRCWPTGRPSSAPPTTRSTRWWRRSMRWSAATRMPPSTLRVRLCRP